MTILLLTYPHLKSEAGPVLDRLRSANADAAAVAEWKRLVASEIRPEGDADEFST